MKNNYFYVLTALLLLLTQGIWGQFNIIVAKDLAPQNFNLDFNTYNRKTATYCAQLSNIVYESESSIRNYVETLNLLYPNTNYQHQFIQHKASSTELMFLGTKDFVIVAFRGTQELKDFRTDAQFLGYKTLIDSSSSSKYQHIPTGHAGFRKSIMHIIDKSNTNIFGSLKTFIEDSLGGKKEQMPIYLTGHSLGAALSNMFIKPLQENNFIYAGSYNFAPPLAIWCYEAEEMRQDSSIFNITYDIVNNTDYITRLPMYSRKNMKHIGKFYRICYTDKKRLDPIIYREKEVYFKYKKFEKLTIKKALFDKYHRMIYYLEGVANINNTVDKIETRSTTMKGCSCLGYKAKGCE